VRRIVQEIIWENSNPSRGLIDQCHKLLPRPVEWWNGGMGQLDLHPPIQYHGATIWNWSNRVAPGDLNRSLRPTTAKARQLSFAKRLGHADSAWFFRFIPAGFSPFL